MGDPNPMKANILILCSLFLFASCGIEWAPLLAVSSNGGSSSSSVRLFEPLLSCDNAGFKQLYGDTEKNINVKLYRELVEDVLQSFTTSGHDVKNFWKNLPAALRNRLSYSLSLIAVEENIKSRGLYEATPLYFYVLSHKVPIDAKVKITDKRDSKDKFAFKLRGHDIGAVYSNSGCGKSPVNKIEVEITDAVVTREKVSQLWRCVTSELSFHLLETGNDNFFQSGPLIIRIPKNVYQKTETSKLITINANQDSLLLNFELNKNRSYPVEGFDGRKTQIELQSAIPKFSGIMSCNSLLKKI